MKISLPIILIILLTTGLYNKSIASHVAGAEISYTYIDSSSYYVTAYIYRDCNGIPLSGTNMYATDGATKLGFSVSKCCGKDITPVCSKSCTRCTDLSCNFGYGLQKWTVSAKMDASKLFGCNITIVWTEGSSGYTSNIYSTPNVYVECKLNRCIIDHSSPKFQFDPRNLLCVNTIEDEYVTASPGTVNDSISYHLTTPLQSVGYPMAYNSPFNYLSPLTYSGSPAYYSKKPKGFHYDSITGEFFFKSTKSESTYMAWEADQYLKDSSGSYYLAGKITRVMEMITMTCLSNSLPVVSSPDTNSSDTIKTCSNIPVQFTVKTSDSNSTDNVTLTALNETSGKISISMGSRPTATFSWTPSSKDVGKAPYTVTFIAKDNKCPLYGQGERRIYIFVKDSLPATKISVINNGCGKYNFGLLPVVDKNFPVTFKWYLDSNLISASQSFPYTNIASGKHVLNLSITNTRTGCVELLKDSFKYDTAYNILPHTMGICKGSAVQLIAARGNHLAWTPYKGLSATNIYNPMASPDTTTVYTVSGTDSAGCKYSDTVKVIVSSYKLQVPGSQYTCTYSTLKLYTNHIQGATFSWQPLSGIVKTIGDTVWVHPAKTTVFYVTSNLKGCIHKDSVAVKVHTKMNSDTLISLCYMDSVILRAPKAKSYKWIDEIHRTLLGTDSLFFLKKAIYLSGYVILSIIEDPVSGCFDSAYFYIKVHNFSPAVSYIPSICYGDKLTLTASGGDNYTWQVPGAGLFYNSTVTYFPKASTNIKVTISTNAYGCTRIFTLPLSVSPMPVRYPSVMDCKGYSVPLSGKSGGYSYSWSPSTGLSTIKGQHTIASPLKTTTYTVLISDSATRCYRADTITVAVDSDCVWPGDANKDLTADYLDVLNIGLGYNNKGPARNPDSISWKPWHADNWNLSLTNGIDFKHFDCNGDGIINAKDTAAISFNYGSKHNKWTAGSGDPKNPPLYFKFVKDTFYAGDTALAYLYAGNNLKPLNHAFGIGYQATFSGSPVVNYSQSLSAECDYFCSGKDLNYIHENKGNKQFDMSVVETNGFSSASLTGKIARLSFMLKDSSSYLYPQAGAKIYAKLLTATVIDNTGTEMPVYGINDSAIVLKRKKNSGIDNSYVLDKIKIYPNPANNEMVIESGNIQIKKLKIYNLLGSEIISEIPGSTHVILNVSALSPGLYMIEISSDNAFRVDKILISR
jgi:hypothetical protein